jgi:hypothetical protein
MPNITHTISTAVDINKSLLAISTLKGLNSWWTTETTGDPSDGGVLEFRFGGGGPDFKVETMTDSEVIWRCVTGPDEWLDTTVEFRFDKNDSGNTALYFTHRGWAAETPFHYHCSMKWASFMLSLKEYLELGEGRPFPNDIQIDGPTVKRTD